MPNSRASTNNLSSVSVKESIEYFLTYTIGSPSIYPFYPEKRVYQGSSGVVYPFPVVDEIIGEVKKLPYRVVILENQYIEVMVLPELGGRIQMAYDKKRNYHFIYYNHVIKPALVGLIGPWISGGIEFNWPQHHRPSTFEPLSYKIEQYTDGSATVWVGELERMGGTFGSAGITLRPDAAYIEIKGRLYNPTSFHQSFLWWANPAVAVNDEYQAIFPPDVHAVFDHGKRDVSTFPIARGIYYKVDYSKGVDISWYKNVPAPTSYMAYYSDFDFVGGYDHGKRAGILHVADHRFAPGKKMWTWGNGAFAKAWERHLTDTDGPYIELMTGVFTDNQPDFCWIQSAEFKEFTQYFFPYGDIPKVSCANERIVLGLIRKEDRGIIFLYSPLAQSVNLKILGPGQDEKKLSFHLEPGLSVEHNFLISASADVSDYQIILYDDGGEEILSYREGGKKGKPIPSPAVAPKEPSEIPTIEELYLIGIHLEQYRHATRNPEAYYQEALIRDPYDIRCNNAMGWRRFRSGDFISGEQYFRKAVERATRYNQNPLDAECYRGLGLCLFYQGKLSEAADVFGRCAWNGFSSAWALYWLALCELRNGKTTYALSAIQRAQKMNSSFLQAYLLAASVLRHKGEKTAALLQVQAVLALAPLYFHAHIEAWILKGATEEGWKELWDGVLNHNAYTILDVAFEYRKAGESEIALDLVKRILTPFSQERQSRGALPLLMYAEGAFLNDLGLKDEAIRSWEKAEQMDFRWCFPNRVEFIEIFIQVCSLCSVHARASYYLGCLLYAFRRYEEAHTAWEKSISSDSLFFPAYRNLAISFYNQKGQGEKAAASLLQALEIAKDDPRLISEYATLQRCRGAKAEDRLAFLESRKDIVKTRDDLVLEYATLLIVLGWPKEALEAIMGRTFHPWEGGEGVVSLRYRAALIALARRAIMVGNLAEARKYLKDALEFPENLGESRLPNTNDNEIRFFLGLCASLEGENAVAESEYTLALGGDTEPSLPFFYNDTPVDAIFYHALALVALGDQENGRELFNRLKEYGENHRMDSISIDYFAVSFPALQPFTEDLNRTNRVFCTYLIGLGSLGLGEIEAAEQNFKEALMWDPSHIGSSAHLNILTSGLWGKIRERLDL